MKRLLSMLVTSLLLLGCNTRVDKSATDFPELSGPPQSPSTSAEPGHAENPNKRPAEISFKEIDEKILKLNCYSCHSGMSPAGDVDLTSYEKIMTSDLALIVPGKPEDSDLYLMVKTKEMPRKAPPLKEAEIQAIYEWIKAGAKR